MKVLDSRVIVQVINDDACTKIGEFVIPEGNREYDKAKVIAVGPKAEGIEVGDIVYTYLKAGKEFSIDGAKYKTISAAEIIVVL